MNAIEEQMNCNGAIVVRVSEALSVIHAINVNIQHSIDLFAQYFPPYFIQRYVMVPVFPYEKYLTQFP